MRKYWKIWAGGEVFTNGQGDEELDYAVNWLRQRGATFFIEWE